MLSTRTESEKQRIDAALPCRMRIVSLSTTFPNPAQPTLGVFVQRRLQALGGLADVQVVSPIAFLRYGNAKGTRLRTGKDRFSLVRQTGNVIVRHPYWFYPPFGGASTAGWLALRMIPFLRSLRRSFPFDLLDTHFGYPDGIAGWLISRALGVPFTMTLRGNEPDHARSPLLGRSMRWALQSAVRVFAVSERLRQFAMALGAPPEKVKTVPNGVDTAIFHPRDQTLSRAQCGCEPEIPLIVSAGPLIERKGHHRVIRVLQSLSRTSRGPVHLAIVGGGAAERSYQQEIRQTAFSLGLDASVRMVGAVSPAEVACWMCAADVLCLASTREGWPNVVNEALACGTPVISTDVGGVPDMIPDSRYGFVIPVGDEAALAGALDQAVRKDWDRSAIASWGQQRSWEHVAQDVLQEMQSVIAAKRGSFA